MKSKDILLYYRYASVHR